MLVVLVVVAAAAPVAAAAVVAVVVALTPELEIVGLVVVAWMPAAFVFVVGIVAVGGSAAVEVLGHQSYHLPLRRRSVFAFHLCPVPAQLLEQLDGAEDPYCY